MRRASNARLKVDPIDLTEEELERLDPEEQRELLTNLEQLYWAAGKESFYEFCQRVEAPGVAVNDNADEDSSVIDIEYYRAKLQPAAHHKLIIDAVQAMADGDDADVDGLMVFMPPGSAKSTYLSTLAPPWLMGRKPGTNVIAASYGQDLANRFGRRSRSVVRSAEFQRMMGATITGDQQAVVEWSLTNGSDYRGTGLGGGITGFRADWFLIDDPVKNREDADSPIIREKVWSGFSDDVQTRLKPGGKIVIVCTRWHEDDICGRLLGPDWKGQSGLWRGTDGRLWRVICLPLLAEHADDPLGRKPGELLWGEWFLEKEAKRLQAQAKKGGTAARTWSSLYQQRPSPAEGTILLRSYWREWKGEVPECDYVVLCYDTAFEDGEENDPSAMTAWGIFASTSRKTKIDEDGRKVLSGEEYTHHHVILLGSWDDHVQSVDLADIMQQHHKQMRPDLILIEKRASGATVIQELKRRRLPVKAWLPKGKPGALGKIPRAHGIAMVLESGAVWYVPGARTQRVIDQCAAFPNAPHDDLVDTVTCGLSFFRDRFMFRTQYDEPDDDEVRAIMNARFESTAYKPTRRLYGGEGRPQRAGQNERRLYGGNKAPRDTDDSFPGKRMTEGTRRRLYGGARKEVD